MERSLWKDQELNRLESFVRQQNIPENTKDYIEQLIVRASKYCGTLGMDAMTPQQNDVFVKHDDFEGDDPSHWVIPDEMWKTERGKRILADAKRIEDSVTEHCAKCGKEIR